MNFLEQAKLRFKDCRIYGSGRWAIPQPYQRTVTLYERRAEAEAQVLDPRYCRVIDLTTTTAPEMKDRHPEGK